MIKTLVSLLVDRVRTEWLHRQSHVDTFPETENLAQSLMHHQDNHRWRDEGIREGRTKSSSKQAPREIQWGQLNKDRAGTGKGHHSHRRQGFTSEPYLHVLTNRVDGNHATTILPVHTPISRGNTDLETKQNTQPQRDTKPWWDENASSPLHIEVHLRDKKKR